jgi:hypothetical protein
VAVDRVEVAIQCDDILGEGIEVLGLIVEALGLDPENDVDAVATSSEDGEPVLLAVLGKNLSNYQEEGRKNDGE